MGQVPTLLIDNHDSFTFNLVHLIGAVYGCAPTVVANDDPAFDRIDLGDFEAVFISPGPGHPARSRDFGVSDLVLRARVPVLGVCLGHQGICHAAGGRVDLAPEPVHGRTSDVFHDGRGLFAGIPSPFKAARYHSLVVTEVPAGFEVLARAADGTVMAVADRRGPRFGVQFHPESVATEFGDELIANFRREYGSRSQARRRPRPRSAVPDGRHPVAQLRARWRRIDLDLEPARVFDRLFAASPAAFWLDGSVPYDGEPRFTYMGDDSGPLAERITHDAWSGRSRVESAAGTRESEGPLLELLGRELAAKGATGPAPAPFGFGYVGYLGYELKAECGGQRAHQSSGPDAGLLFVDRLVVFDHAAGAVFLGVLERSEDPPEDDWLAETTSTLQALASGSADEDPAGLSDLDRDLPSDFASVPDDDAYLRNIRTAQEEIRRGESYEICLTRQTSVGEELDQARTWAVLRRTNPAPYAALFRIPEVAVLSCSPERFLKVTATSVIESRPIKGTVRRGESAKEDDLLRDALRVSTKDRAENLMIVDLVRNDLGRVSEPGSIEVTAFAQVERLPSAHQLVSTVRGVLAPDRDGIDCVRAAFPGGSMTGAPKERAMEIIDRLEGASRGVYAGALGWFGLDGALDLGMVIRTLVMDAGGARIGSGGAIVSESDPAAEIAEADLKRRAVLEGLRRRKP